MATLKKKSSHPVKVNWTFAPKPPQPEMITLKNGQSVIKNVPHQPWAESDGARITKVYCYGCGEYFKNYTLYYFRHGGMHVNHHTSTKGGSTNAGSTQVQKRGSSPKSFSLKGGGQVVVRNSKGVRNITRNGKLLLVRK